jgi:hypothetical protein
MASMANEDRVRLGRQAHQQSYANLGRAQRRKAHGVIELPEQDVSNPDNPVVLPSSDVKHLISLLANRSHSLSNG